MLRAAILSDDFADAFDDPRPRPRPTAAALALTLLSSALVVGLTVGAQGPGCTTGMLASAPARIVAADSLAFDPAMLDPRPALGRQARAVWPAAPLAAALRPAERAVLASVEPALPPGRDAAPPVPSLLADGPPRTVTAVPLPAPRPPELREPGGADGPRLADRPTSRRTRIAGLPTPREDNRSFLEKLFGIEPAYAALPGGPVTPAPAPRLSPSPRPSPEAGAAVYDISARTVTLPSGERLEAHSGLGDKLDDPRSVDIRMRGATPPGTYDLSEREAAFHGVRALRLNPVGGSAAVFGRAGLLAHTFMLGPNGDSNGCVSFRDYERFLQAYLRGEIRRLVVVTGGGWSGPALANRRPGLPDQPPSRAGDA